MNIYIYSIKTKNNSSFGNHLCNIIISLYIYYINKNVKIYFIDNDFKYKIGITLFDILPNIKEFINIIPSWEEFNKKNIKTNIIRCSKINNIKSLKFNDKLKNLQIQGISRLYRYIHEIYNNLPKKFQNLLTINQNIINDDILKLKNTEYIAIHIRYGDKLNIISHNQKRFQYILYTPEYYINIINYFISKKKIIYVVTDDNEIVQNFILKKFKNVKNIILLDINWINAYYLLLNSKYLVLSQSTMSWCAFVLNKKLEQAIYIDIPDKILKKYIQQFYDYKINKNTDIILNKRLLVLNKQSKNFNYKRFLLNYNILLIKKMIKHKNNL